MAALLTLRDALLTSIRAILLDPGLDCYGIWKICTNRNRIPVADRFQQCLCFLRKPSRVERENLDFGCVLRDGIENDHVLGAEATRKRCREMSGFDSLEMRDQFARLLGEVHYNSNLQRRRRYP